MSHIRPETVMVPFDTFFVVLPFIIWIILHVFFKRRAPEPESASSVPMQSSPREVGQAIGVVVVALIVLMMLAGIMVAASFR